MDVKLVNPFVSAAYKVMSMELGIRPVKKSISLDNFYHTSDDVAVLIGVTGRVCGTILYELSEETALRIASAMLGKALDRLDEVAHSAIAELGNVIAGQATIEMERTGFSCRISPPTLLLGRGLIVSTIDIERIRITLGTVHGDLAIVIALQEAP